MIKKVFSIKLENNLLQYLQKKNKKCITLTINKSGGGCCPTFEVIEIVTSLPSNTSDYTEYDSEDIKIFISNNTRILASTLRFTLRKTLFISVIGVEGISIIERTL